MAAAGGEVEPGSRASSIWVRVQVGLLTLLLIGAAVYRFAFVLPLGRIDTGLLVLTALIVLLTLSETFDNFSVGKLLTVSREARKQEQQVDKLEKQNAQLMSQLFSLSNQQAQSQTHIKVDGDYHAGGRVEQATKEEVMASRTQDDRAEQPPASAMSQPQPSRQVIDYQAVEQYGIERFATLHALDRATIVHEAKLVGGFREVDRISTTNLLFDAYLRSPEREIFLEVRPGLISPTFRDRLYMMLAKIEQYGLRAGKTTQLELIIVRLPGRDATHFEARLLDEFRPAIANKLLSITEVPVSAEDEARFYRRG